MMAWDQRHPYIILGTTVPSDKGAVRTDGKNFSELLAASTIQI